MTTWPNVISLTRLLLTPFVLWFMKNGHMREAFFLFLFAMLTDFVDGYAARVLASKSLLGHYLDPLADKVLLTSLYGALAWWGMLDPWVTYLVVGRDVVMVFFVVIFWHRIRVEALMWGKVNTLVQMILVMYLLGAAAYGRADPRLAVVLTGLVVALALLSGVAYAWAGIRMLGWRRG